MPTYAQGYARDQSGSDWPEGWDGLRGLWAMGLGPTGSTVQDISGRGTSGTLTNMEMADWMASEKGYALDFDGSNESVDLDNAGSSHVTKPSLPVSIFALIYPHQVGTTVGVFENDSWGGAGVYRGVVMQERNDGKIVIGFGDGGGTASSDRRNKVGSTVVSTNTWYSIVGVIRGAADMDIYLDGANDGGSYAGTGGALAYNDAGAIGLGGSGYFDGLIPITGLWDRELTPNEISRLYTDPYALLQPRRRVFYFTTGATIEEPSPVSVTWSVVAPTLKKTITPSAVSSTWAATSPSLLSKLTPSPVSASWSIPTPNTGADKPRDEIDCGLYLGL